MTKFRPGGPKRYAHQVRGLRKLLETGGVGALLYEPGLGKTATTLDFMSILALKKAPDDNGVREARVLVVCPLAAIDTWVKQAGLWVSPDVDFWAEAMGGSIVRKALTLAARGNQPYTATVKKNLLKLATPPRQKFHVLDGVRQPEPARADAWDKAVDLSWRAQDNPDMIASEGPDGLGTSRPRIVIEVTNFDAFNSRKAVGSRNVRDVLLEGIKRFDPDLVVLDESHKIKGVSSNTSRLMERVGNAVPRRILLTGTVMPAGPLDVFAQWRFLDPYAFGEVQADGSVQRATFDGFKQRYAVLGGYMGREVKGFRNLDDLQNIMARRAAVARKKDELDLPPVIESIVPVILSPREKQAYEDMKKDLGTKLLGGQIASASSRLVQMMRLRQITSGHLPDDNGNVVTIGTSKVDTVKSLVQDVLEGENRIVVFCLFTHELHAIKDALSVKGTEVMAISGETDPRDRQAMRKRFGDRSVTDRIVMVAQIKTLSIAVNELVTAQNVVFASLSQQRDDLIQGIDRFNRIGQTGEKVTVWFVEAPGTIDTVIHRSHNERTTLENAVLAHILGDAAAEDYLSRPSQALSDEGAHDAGAARAEDEELDSAPGDAESVA